MTLLTNCLLKPIPLQSQVLKKLNSATRKKVTDPAYAWCRAPCSTWVEFPNYNTDLRSQFARTRVFSVCSNGSLSLYLPNYPDLPPVDSCRKNTRGQRVDETRTLGACRFTSGVTGKDRKNTTKEQAMGENPPLYLLPLPLSFPICLHWDNRSHTSHRSIPAHDSSSKLAFTLSQTFP